MSKKKVHHCRKFSQVWIKTYGVVTTQLSHFHLFEVIATVLIYTLFLYLVFFYFLKNAQFFFYQNSFNRFWDISKKKKKKEKNHFFHARFQYISSMVKEGDVYTLTLLYVINKYSNLLLKITHLVFITLLFYFVTNSLKRASFQSFA